MTHDSTLTGPQRKLLWNALQLAFPRPDELQRLLSFHDIIPPADVPWNGDYATAIHMLVQTCEARGRIPALLKAAVDTNPGNERLRNAVEDLTGSKADQAPILDYMTVARALRWAEGAGCLGRMIGCAIGAPSIDEAAFTLAQQLHPRAAPGAHNEPAAIEGTWPSGGATPRVRSDDGSANDLIPEPEPLSTSAGETLLELAAEYDAVRMEMPSGGLRTLRMEGIAARMRALAAEHQSQLPRLMKSRSAGKRLAALSLLQEQPRRSSLPWVVERLNPGAEKPFVGYHAAMALRNAARVFRQEAPDEVRSAIQSARGLLGEDNAFTDRWKMLQSADDALDGRA